MKIIDVIGIILIVLGISMTALNYYVARRSIANVESVTIHEITPCAPANST